MQQHQYVIVRQAAKYPAVADTWNNEHLSHHESEADARSAVREYEHHDRRRALVQ